MENQKQLPKMRRLKDGEHQFEVHGLITVDIRNGYVFITSTMGTTFIDLTQEEFKQRLALLKGGV